MCYVNFVRESTAFMRYACDQGLTANERLLWYALFHVMNARAKGSDWPEGLIPVPNKQLLSLVPFGEDSLTAARNKLKQRGLIDYQPGKKNAAPPMYKMVYFCAELSTGYAQDVGCYPDISGKTPGNIGGNMQGNNRGNIGGNIQGNTGGIILNYKANGNHTSNEYENDDDDAAAYGQAREAQVHRQFREATGRTPMPLEVRTLVMAQERYGVDDEVVNQAIGEAASYGARSPAHYAEMLLGDWSRHGVRTAYDLVCLRYDGRVAKEE